MGNIRSFVMFSSQREQFGGKILAAEIAANSRCAFIAH